VPASVICFLRTPFHFAPSHLPFSPCSHCCNQHRESKLERFAPSAVAGLFSLLRQRPKAERALKASALQIVRQAEAEASLSVLIPGDPWHPLDAVPAPEYVPPSWIGPHVGLRLVEAFKTLATLPVMNGPQRPHNTWPWFKPQWEDLLAQQEAAAEDEQLRADAFNRARLAPTAIEVGRMEAALVWPAHYLQSRPLIMRMVGSVAVMRARGLESDLIARKLKRRPVAVRSMNRTGLDLIAAGLRRDQVPVF
jgi:hypothetical protein